MGLKLQFPVGELDLDRLISKWRWLCSDTVKVVARNAFGDLFLATQTGKVLWLDLCGGMLNPIANSEKEFAELLENPNNREQWFAEADAREYAELGLEPDNAQCIAFKLPIVFAESGEYPNNAYLANLYEQVSFLGDLHRQMAFLPDGAKVQLEIRNTQKQ